MVLQLLDCRADTVDRSALVSLRPHVFLWHEIVSLVWTTHVRKVGARVHHEVLTFVKSVGAAAEVGISCCAVLTLKRLATVRHGLVVCHLTHITFVVYASLAALV